MEDHVIKGKRPSIVIVDDLLGDDDVKRILADECIVADSVQQELILKLPDKRVKILARGTRKELSFLDKLPTIAPEANFVTLEERILSSADRVRLQAAINKRDRKARKRQNQWRKENQ